MKKNIQTRRMENYFIEAGYNILLKESLDDLTVRNIAKKAGYSYATIYNYFENADELMYMIGIKVLQKLKDYLQKCYDNLKEEKKCIDLLKLTYKEYVEYFLENESVYRFIFFKNINTKNIIENIDLPKPNLFNLQQIIMKECVDEGYIEHEKIKIVGDLLTNSINGLLLLYFSGKENINKQELSKKVNKYIDYLITN